MREMAILRQLNKSLTLEPVQGFILFP
jgi:hypothetical protein